MTSPRARGPADATSVQPAGLRKRVRAEERELLKVVAQRGGMHAYVPTSSSELANDLGVSQQTAARWILSLLESGLLERRLGSRGQQVRLTPGGVDVLAVELKELEGIFARGSEVRVTGLVVAGDGEGAYYMRQPYYRDGFQALVGFAPYPGTLNVRLSGSDLETMRALRGREGLEIPLYETPERTFGGVTAFPARVQEIVAAVIFPHRTRHEDVLEVISPACLRKELSLVDGDNLVVQVDARPVRKKYTQPGPSVA